jgi:hypothetical protein
MAKAKILKPGMVVFDIPNSTYVWFRGHVADKNKEAFVRDPKSNAVYVTEIRELNRKELGLP